jgi:putative toxin-antitoxin system antitoxin component (TIGR02293 family)
LQRRKEEGKLTPEESDRLYRVTDITRKAIDLFEGDIDKAGNWLKTPKKALGGKTPLEYSDTQVGYDEVCQLIGRLEHGVF